MLASGRRQRNTAKQRGNRGQTLGSGEAAKEERIDRGKNVNEYKWVTPKNLVAKVVSGVVSRVVSNSLHCETTVVCPAERGMAGRNWHFRAGEKRDFCRHSFLHLPSGKNGL
jgi:hypothetical protein